MSEHLFEHYKYHADDAEPEIGYHFVKFDSVMTDDILRELMGDVEPVHIKREGTNCGAGYYSSQTYDYELLNKVREWEPLRAYRNTGGSMTPEDVRRTVSCGKRSRGRRREQSEI